MSAIYNVRREEMRLASSLRQACHSPCWRQCIYQGRPSPLKHLVEPTCRRDLRPYTRVLLRKTLRCQRKHLQRITSAEE